MPGVLRPPFPKSYVAANMLSLVQKEEKPSFGGVSGTPLVCVVGGHLVTLRAPGAIHSQPEPLKPRPPSHEEVATASRAANEVTNTQCRDEANGNSR